MGQDQRAIKRSSVLGASERVRLQLDRLNLDFLWLDAEALSARSVGAVYLLLGAICSVSTSILFVRGLPTRDEMVALGGRHGVLRRGEIVVSSTETDRISVEPGIGVETSGTTGRRRLVLHARSTALAAISRVVEVGSPTGLTVASCFPMSTIGGVVSALRCALTGDVLTLWAIDARDSWPFDDSSIGIVASPSAFAPSVARLPTPLPMVSFGGGPIAQKVLRKIAAVTPVVVGYGMTETFGAVTLASSHGSDIDLGLGNPLSGVQIRLSEPFDHATPDVRQIEVLPGFDPPWILDRSSAILGRGWTSRWFRTGDCAKVGSSGDLVYAGRGDDVIVRGGRAFRMGHLNATLAKCAPGAYAVKLVELSTDGSEQFLVVLPAEIAAAGRRRILSRLRLEHGIAPASVVEGPVADSRHGDGWSARRVSGDEVLPNLSQRLRHLPGAPA